MGAPGAEPKHSHSGLILLPSGNTIPNWKTSHSSLSPDRIGRLRLWKLPRKWCLLENMNDKQELTQLTREEVGCKLWFWVGKE